MKSIAKRKKSGGRKKKAPARATTRRSKKIIKARVIRTVRQMPLLSYEDILLRSIIGTEDGHKVAESAALFSSVLSNLSEGMRDLHYKSGMPIGRALYRLYEKDRKYEWYEESVHDLVSFLERAGYKRVTYNVSPGRIEISIHNKDSMQLGTNMHGFEAGIMSGFLTAARMRLVHVNEELCCENGSEFCRFVTSDQYEPGSIDPQIVEKFFGSVNGRVRETGRQRAEDMKIPEEYYLLASLMLMHKDYSSEIGQIMVSMGRRLAANMKMTRSNIENAMWLLGLGDARITSLKPLRGSISYSRLRAREEFLGMSIPFLDGLLSGAVGKGSRVEVVAAANANRYNVKLTEKKAINVR